MPFNTSFPTHSKLRKNLQNKVFGGRDPFLHNLCVTNTGTGMGSANSCRIGQMCLDSSSGNWFLCTVAATSGAGTWVKINA